MFSLSAVAIALAMPCAELRTELRQVAPDSTAKAWFLPATPREKTRAVVLIHGLFVHPLRPSKATKPWLRDWQEPGSKLVKLLAREFDVFAFAYAQTVPADEVARNAGLRDAVAKLRKAGYTEVVLIGHSAGGVIARHFVQNFPDAGVTKVIAVAAPFAGVESATLKIGYPKVQAPFVESLTPDARAEAVKANKNALGESVQIVCVVCKLKLVDSDGLVSTRSQWTADLQEWGVPAVLTPVHHFAVMNHSEATKSIAELASKKLTRWSPGEVEEARTMLFGEPAAGRDK